MQLYLVDEGGVARDVAVLLFAEGELVGEVEAVDAAGVHELEGVDEAREHGLADDMDDGVALAVGLVEGLAGEHEVAAVVEAYALRVFGVGTVAGLHHLVVESRGVLLDVGVGLHEVGEVVFLCCVDGGAVFAGLLHLLHAGHVDDVLHRLGVGCVGEGLLAAVESVADGLQEDVVVDFHSLAAHEAEGCVAAQGPGEGVGAVFEARGAIVAADKQEDCGCNDE